MDPKEAVDLRELTESREKLDHRAPKVLWGRQAQEVHLESLVQVVLSVHQVPSAEREQRVSVVETRDQALLVSQVVRVCLDLQV